MRNIGIIGDGGTDREIFSYIAKTLIKEEINYIELNRQSLHDAVDKYWHISNKKKEYYFPSEHAVALKKSVINILYGAIGDFSASLPPGDWLKSTDVLLLSTDAEKVLEKPEKYFDIDNISILTILYSAINEFYHVKLDRNEAIDYLPLIIPIIAFPSTEVFIAAAKKLESKKIYGYKPEALKKELYGTAAALSPKQIEELALNHLSIDGINNICKLIPESRLFIQTLLSLN